MTSSTRGAENTLGEDPQVEPGVTDGHMAVLIDIVDYLSVGVILTDANCRPIFTNRAAREIITAESGLAFANSHLANSSAIATQQLHKIIEKVAAHDETAPLASSVFAMLLPRKDGQNPLSVIVAPVRKSASKNAHAKIAAILFVSDPDFDVDLPKSLLRTLFGLTQSEAKIAVAVANGESLEQLAKTSGVKVSTVRTHLKKIFEKTGRVRQAELVRMLTKVYGFLRFD